MSLRERPRVAGILDETLHEGMRFVSARCANCGRAQHWAMPVGKLARCIVCGTVLPGQVGLA